MERRPIVKKPKYLKLFSFLLLSSFLLIVCKETFGQGPPVNSAQARANAIKYVKNKLVNVSKEEPKVFTTNDKYVRFIMAPPGTAFYVDQTYRNSPQQAGNWFLNNW
jgi:hypothetical protein